MNISILGTGAYGLALSKMFVRKGVSVTMWTKIDYEYTALTNNRCNQKVLPDYHVSDDVTFTMNMEGAIKNANIVIIAIPVKFIRETILEVKKYYDKRQYIFIASKGIEQDTLKMPYDIAKEILKTNKIGVISGGTFAIDMIKDTPIGLVAASKNKMATKVIKSSLENDILSIITSNDVIGTEIWGAVKNIIAIGCGIIEGMNYTESTKSMFFTKCFSDLTKLICDNGGKLSSAFTYAGIGDLFLTCTSLKSRNYTFGKMIGKREDKEVINDYLNETTTEGYYTLKSFYNLIQMNKEKNLLIDTLYKIIYEEFDPEIIDLYLKK